MRFSLGKEVRPRRRASTYVFFICNDLLLLVQSEIALEALIHVVKLEFTTHNSIYRFSSVSSE